MIDPDLRNATNSWRNSDLFFGAFSFRLAPKRKSKVSRKNGKPARLSKNQEEIDLPFSALETKPALSKSEDRSVRAKAYYITIRNSVNPFIQNFFKFYLILFQPLSRP